MNARVPEINDNDAYTISETCGLLGIHRATLLRYTKDGKIAAMEREADHKKLYRGRDIKRLITTTI